MISIKSFLVNNGWVEVTWVDTITSKIAIDTMVDGEVVQVVKNKQEEIIVHCESYSGHPEHIQLLRNKAVEFNTDLTELEPLIVQVQNEFIMPTEEDLLSIQKEQELILAQDNRKRNMLTGDFYVLNGVEYLISFTKDDGDGMVQVKNGFELGLSSTNIHFDCGTVLPITKEEFPAFALWFVNKRNSFF